MLPGVELVEDWAGDAKTLLKIFSVFCYISWTSLFNVCAPGINHKESSNLTLLF